MQKLPIIINWIKSIFSHLESGTQVLDDDVIFVSSTNPVIVDLCSSPLYNRRPALSARTSRMVREMKDRQTSFRCVIESIVTVTSPTKRLRIDTPNIADKGIKPINCAVCLEPPNENKPMSTICGHIFCEPCIKMAIAQSKKCPLCKKNLSLKSIHPIYF